MSDQLSRAGLSGGIGRYRGNKQPSDQTDLKLLRRA